MIRRMMMVAALTLASATAFAAPTKIGITETPAHHAVTHRLTIISAYSCPFCRALDEQGMSTLRGKWAPNGVQIESVPVLIGPTDIAATIAATCGSSKGYAHRSTILFRAQPEISGNWNAADDKAKNEALSKPDGSGAPEIAKLAGIDDLAPSLGLTKATLEGCLSNPRRQKIVMMRNRAAIAKWHFLGTPTVLLDGKRVGHTWNDVQTALEHAKG